MTIQSTSGGDLLCDSLLAEGIDVCFANPGTSEMHFVAALDRKPEMRCVLGLFEGVVTGAADGYARMAEKPAATLLHLGPGLANGLANLHNARRARTPLLNLVGDHATHHLPYDALLTSDIEALAKPMSAWVRRVTHPSSIAADLAAAHRAALTQRGVATLILPSDMIWSEAVPAAFPPGERIQRKSAPAGRIAEAAQLLSRARRPALILGDEALRALPLEVAARVSEKTGARLVAPVFNARMSRGRGRVPIERIPYPVDAALTFLEEIDAVVLIGATAPVAFFAYPGRPSTLLPEGCEILALAEVGDDLLTTLNDLAEALGAPGKGIASPSQHTLPQRPVAGPLSAEDICALVARHLPEDAVVVDESITAGSTFPALSFGAAPHDYLQLTGGSIGDGIPLCVGAAIGAPERKVVGLQADGSGLYTVQGLWTQARERLDVVTVILSNRAYAILKGEMANVGIGSYGRNAQAMLELDRPACDWVSIANGFGVEAARAETTEALDGLLATAMRRQGPFLIEAVI